MEIKPTAPPSDAVEPLPRHARVARVSRFTLVTFHARMENNNFVISHYRAGALYCKFKYFKIRLDTLSTDKIPSVLYCEKLLVQAFQAICNCQSAFGSRKFVNLL